MIGGENSVELFDNNGYIGARTTDGIVLGDIRHGLSAARYIHYTVTLKSGTNTSVVIYSDSSVPARSRLSRSTT
jgi:hypothetical protein